MTEDIKDKILYIDEPPKKEAYRQRYGKEITDEGMLDDDEYYSLEEEEKKYKEIQNKQKDNSEKEVEEEESIDEEKENNDNEDNTEDFNLKEEEEEENNDNDEEEEEDNNDEDDEDDEDFEEDIEEEIEEEPKDEYTIEIEKMEKKIENLTNQVKEIKFPRAESKTDFASGIINTTETKKICNLDEEECGDLAEKRKFYNFLKYFGWDGLAERVIANVRDIEDYSLSKGAKLLDSVFIDRVKQDSRNIQEERGNRKR